MSELYQLHRVDTDVRAESETRVGPPPNLDAAYRTLVVDRIEERGKTVSLDVGPRALDLAHRLSEAAIGARDVAELHVEAVSTLTHGTSRARTQAIVAAAQLVLIEVLGHLADRYRDRALHDHRSWLR